MLCKLFFFGFTEPNRALTLWFMLSGNGSISNYTKPNIAIWMTLAFQGGLLNMGGLLACRSFVSHVTGFATLFGRDWSLSDYGNAGKMLLVPVSFLLGAALSGYLVDVRIQSRQRPNYALVFGILLGLLLLVVISGFNGVFGVFGEPLEKTHDYTLLFALSFICGLQNGTITLVSRAVVRTTHLTGITTDLGIGLARVLNRRKLGSHLGDEGAANWMRAGIWFFFIAGTTLGFQLYSRYAYRGFLLPVGIYAVLFFLMTYFQISIARGQRQP